MIMNGLDSVKNLKEIYKDEKWKELYKKFKSYKNLRVILLRIKNSKFNERLIKYELSSNENKEKLTKEFYLDFSLQLQAFLNHLQQKRNFNKKDMKLRSIQ